MGMGRVREREREKVGRWLLDIFGKSVNLKGVNARSLNQDNRTRREFPMCVFSGPQIKPRPKITLTHNKTKEHIDGRIHMCELYLSSVCCFGLLNHASATRFFYLYMCACCFGLLNHASSTRFFYLYICASYDASIVLI